MNPEELLSGLLATEGFEVITASNGVDALKYLMSEIPDAIICDIMMPRTSGLELYEQICESQQPKFIFMTGGAFDPRIRARLESVQRPVIDKPIDAGALHQAIAGIMAASAS